MVTTLRKRNDFTVGDLLSKIADNFLEIRIEEEKDSEILRKWVIPPHGKHLVEIPDEILNKKVSMVIQYFKCLSIIIEK